MLPGIKIESVTTPFGSVIKPSVIVLTGVLFVFIKLGASFSISSILYLALPVTASLDS